MTWVSGERYPVVDSLVTQRGRAIRTNVHAPMTMLQTTNTDTQEARPHNTVVSPSAPSDSLKPATNTQETAQVSPLVAVIPSSATIPPPRPSTEAITRAPTVPEDPVPATPDNLSANRPDPQITLTFLLVSGQRRTLSFPEETTVARVKEILWNTWSAESQGEQPPAPSFLRLLHLGKIWTDDVRLVGKWNDFKISARLFCFCAKFEHLGFFPALS